MKTTTPSRSIVVVFSVLAALFWPVRFVAASEDLEREFGDIVLLQPPSRSWVQLTSDTEYIYTSNPLLLPDSGLFPAQEDGLFYESLGLRFTPPALGNLSSALYFSQDFVRYAENTQYDFDVQSAGVQLRYPIEDWFALYGGGSAERLTLCGSGREFFKMYDAQLGLWRTQQLGEHAAVFGGYQFDWRPSTPGAYTRFDNTPFAGVTATLLPRLTAQCQYRFSVRDYSRLDRHDCNHIVTLSLTYTFNPYIALSASTSYSRNDSSLATRDYELFEGGGGLKLSVKF